MICLGSSNSEPGSGFLWFIIIVEFIVSAVATVLIAAGVQDMMVSSLADRSLPWAMIVRNILFVLEAIY